MIVFRSGLTDVSGFEVRCHQGSGKGPPPLVIADAGKGPCRVIATTARPGKMVAWINLTGPSTWTCFEGGQRTCE